MTHVTKLLLVVFLVAFFQPAWSWSDEAQLNRQEVTVVKKKLEAQATGNYQAMSQIAQDMMRRSGEAQLAADEAKREPVEINLRFNNNPGATIDPDAVVFEKSGVIALKSLGNKNDQDFRITVYFDPVRLKDTTTLSSFDLGRDERGTRNKTTVRNITIALNGPTEVIEPWCRQIATDKILALIDTK